MNNFISLRLCTAIILLFSTLTATANDQDFTVFYKKIVSDFGKSVEVTTLACNGELIDFVDRKCVFHEMKGLFAHIINNNIIDLHASATRFDADLCASKISKAFEAYSRASYEYMQYSINGATGFCGDLNLQQIRDVLEKEVD